MRRRLFNILAAVSMVLTIAIVVLAVRSFNKADFIFYVTSESENYFVVSVGGAFGLGANFPFFNLNALGWAHVEHGPIDNSFRQWLWVEGELDRPADFPTLRYVAIPMWMPLAILLVPPFLSVRRWRREQRAKMEGRCHTCGYNLTGNVSGTCPECGTAVPPKAPMDGATT
jgi:hypothetical protein